MNHRQIIESCLAKVLAKLSDESVREVFDFAEFLALKEEQRMWATPRLSPQEIAEMYGDDEYTEADVKVGLKD